MTTKNAFEHGYIIDTFPRNGVYTTTMKAAKIIPTLVILLDNPKSILMNRAERNCQILSVDVFFMKLQRDEYLQSSISKAEKKYYATFTEYDTTSQQQLLELIILGPS
ncbi:MAG: hypothetical protein EZS28_010573 [Streblomastix strix]|uniref:Uncharacterized protein n=1 Tax=Streblomastix strix TaxID=222440 RepID=A0A5J4WGU0_9EUKA|nr:MAG: hypothetical protein EZS28_010573 [Streblomastix strix]